MEFNDGDESMCNMINQEGGMGLGPKYCKDCERKKLIPDTLLLRPRLRNT